MATKSAAAIRNSTHQNPIEIEPVACTNAPVADECRGGGDGKGARTRLLYSLQERPPTLIALFLGLQVCSCTVLYNYKSSLRASSSPMHLAPHYNTIQYRHTVVLLI